MKDDAKGIWPSQSIKGLIKSGAVDFSGEFEEHQLQPASLDLRLGDRAYRLRSSFLPGRNYSVEEKLSQFSLYEIGLIEGAVLEAGCVYLVPLLEFFNLPEGLAARTNPKSSTGRVDVFVRVVSDGADAFDTILHGYEGLLYLEISPRTFPIFVRRGLSLSQIRFFCSAVHCSDSELKSFHQDAPLVRGGEACIEKGVRLTVDLLGQNRGGLIGFRAKRYTRVLDLSLSACYDVEDFWDPIYGQEGKDLLLDPHCFYILASRECVMVLPFLAAEMVPFDPMIGEFRVHYAGFFDPGFGYDKCGGIESHAVLEVRNYELPFTLTHGQMIGRLVYESLTERSVSLYGDEIGSYYQGQGLKLSRHFKDFKGLT
ncbi:MAG: 2'-deoxycytidine 5'-triphosphate deaminase [Alphaproteobacteria bacterium]|nr:2'-deoxycytidine 5'-triphosphate deaminase [Alphaproteobacteria bacterium]